MSLASMNRLPILAEELQSLRGYRNWFLVLGILMVVLGSVVIGGSCLAQITLMATWLFGFLLLASGISEFITAFAAGQWSGRLVHVLIGLLYAVVGLMIIEHPARSAVELTLILSIFLIVGGVFRIAFALVERFSGFGWVLLNGVVTLILGLMIYKQWPYSGEWVIGLFVGIELIFNGWAWIMLSALLRRIPAQA